MGGMRQNYQMEKQDLYVENIQRLKLKINMTIVIYIIQLKVNVLEITLHYQLANIIHINLMMSMKS